MGNIGVNIKKIRKLKQLSQSKFAELFGFTRASIGAYEEERAEPKIEAIIKMCSHFNISLESFITKELTVNEISNFDVFKTMEAKNISTSQHKEIFIVDSSTTRLYLSEGIKEKNKNQYKSVFLTKNTATEQIFECYDSSLIGHQIYPKDLLFAQRIKQEDLFENALCFVVSENEISFGIIKNFDLNQLTLITHQINQRPLNMLLSDQKEVWLVIGKYSEVFAGYA